MNLEQLATPLVITTTSPLPAATAVTAYAETLAATGGTAPYSWTATGLPAGLTLDPATGALSGTPKTAAGAVTIDVTVTDATGATATSHLTMAVNAAPRRAGSLVPWAVGAAAALLIVFAIWNSGGSDKGVKTTSKPTATASATAGSATDLTALMNDARVAQIKADIQSGKIKDANDLNGALARANFTPEQQAKLAEALKGVISSKVPSNQAMCPRDYVVKAGETFDVPAGCNIKGDVEVLVNGKFVPQKQGSDPKTGTIVSCPQGCTIRAPGGANVGPRTVPDIKSEMEKTGCENGCATVKVYTIGSPATASAPNGKASPPQASSSSCGPELKRNEVRVIPAGCIIVGDVFARHASSDPWIWTTDKVQDTGSVQKLSKNLEIKAPFGASVQDSKTDLKSLVETTKAIGCDLNDGCSGGVFGWIHQP